MRAKFIKRPNMNFELGGNSYKKMDIGSYRKPKEGDLIYIKPNAINLYHKRISIPVGDSQEVKDWVSIIKTMDPNEPHSIRYVYQNSVIIKINLIGIEIDKFLISYEPNDEINSLEY